MLASLAVAGLSLTLHADLPASPGDKTSPAQRIARAEAELCLPRCPPAPAQPSSDWMRSPEGRSVNACAMSCRVDPPAAELYRKLVETATARGFDAEAPSVKVLGRGAPELMRRLHTALRESEGRRLGRLCTRARAGAGRPGELTYLECTGRTALAAGAPPQPPPDPIRALACATTFAETEAEWFTRCPGLERRAEADIENCAAEENASRARCERDALAGIARAMRQRPKR